MKILAYVVIVIAVISLIVGIISKLTMAPVAFLPGGLEAQAFLVFTNTCFLIAITLILLGMLKK